MKLLVYTIAPYFWIKLDKNGKAMEKGQFSEAAFLNTIPKKVGSIIGVAPASATTFHRVNVPTKKRANMLAAVPFALEESLSEDLENLHFTVLDWTPNDDAHVAVAAKQDINRWIQTFNDAGVKLDGIVPEQLLLPIHPSCTTTIIKRDDKQFTIKTAPFQSFSCDEDAFEYWWSDELNRESDIAVNDQSFALELKSLGGERVNHWAIGSDFRGWLEQVPTQLTKAPSLLQGKFEPEHLKPNSTWLNIAAGIALCSLLLLGGSHWVEASKLQKRYDANQQRIRALFDQAFPDQEYLNRPRRQIASLLSISEDSPASELFQYLLDVSTQVVQINGAEFEEINYRDGQLQIGVSAASFATLEKMTSQISSTDGLQAALISSGTRDQGVTGQIKMAKVN